MSDVNKLSGIITALELQAKKISEFSGLLSVVNDARKEIEASKGLLEVASVESRQFLRNSKENFVGLERHLLAQAKKLEQIESTQNQVLHRLTSLDILTPQVFSEATNASQNILLDNLQKLESKIDRVQAVQAQRHKNLLGLWSISFVVIVAALAFLR